MLIRTGRHSKLSMIVRLNIRKTSRISKNRKRSVVDSGKIKKVKWWTGFKRIP